MKNKYIDERREVQTYDHFIRFFHDGSKKVYKNDFETEIYLQLQFSITSNTHAAICK